MENKPGGLKLPGFFNRGCVSFELYESRYAKPPPEKNSGDHSNYSNRVLCAEYYFLRILLT